MRGLSYVPHLLLAMGCAFATAADESPIQLPTVPTIPNPMPSPITRTIRLSGETVYVISSKVDCSVRVHPAGLVKISKEQGPIRIRSKFVDGNGSVESRKYDGPFVWILEPNQGKGTVELDVIPYGFKIDKEIVSDSFDVDSGPGPQPPPVVDAFTQSIKDAFAKETSPDKIKYVTALASLYRTAATTTVQDATVKTWADLFTDMKTASATLLPMTAIPEIRKAVGVRLNATLGTDSTKPIDRALAASEFVVVATALVEGAK